VISGESPSPTPAEIAERAEVVRRRITEAGGDPGAVGLLAVTKGFGSDVVASAQAAGLSDLGENYAQELLAKAATLRPEAGPVRWHAIGRLQRNKVRRLAPVVHLWQSVDRRELGLEIAARAPGAAVLVQVNVSGEDQKGGCPPSDTATLVGTLQDAGLDVRGLMAVGSSDGAEAARPGFRLLRQLTDDLGLEIRSMGMSADLEVAVQEGSNLVRVGTALFGARAERTGA
jgi:pyridoxal phosphate enzyme (YggS family)